MSASWKLENDTFFAKINGVWNPVKAEEVYCSAFGDGSSESSFLPEAFEPIKAAFPEYRFSKFSVSPELSLSYEDDGILLKAFFRKAGKEYSIALPQKDGPDYGFAGNTWVYYSGDYYQILEVLDHAGISSEQISFHQYISILNSANEYPGLSITDQVSTGLTGTPEAITEHQPAEIKANLYPYQKIGFRWLKFVTDDNCGCVLGDEMGLGKTLQVISLFAERNTKKEAPFLVVAPLSLLENWKREINRFAPSLDTIIHHGVARTGRYKELLEHDVIITSYGATITDLSILEMVKWDVLVLDEAQNIKNPDAIRTTSIKQIPCRASIAVTGTPFENHITDIWSILDFTVPGCLGSLSSFRSVYTDDLTGAARIEPLLTALMLRRKVADVAKDLPEKVIVPQALVMDGPEAQRYENARQDVLKSFEGNAATLAVLTKLRMYCTHPFLLTEEDKGKDPRKCSSKYDRFCELIDEIVGHGEKVIVFTSYTEMFSVFMEDIPFRYGIPVDCINGSTPAGERQAIVDSFSEKNGPAMLVLNPRAAGVGLNITAANHVIHYNLEWNPAIEDQATARAYRRGQDKTVFVYRLFYTNTVEEVVNEKINSKRSMSDVAVVGSEGTEDTRSLILKALKMSPV